ncbi:tripartite tricarboxylate transporter substrate binding protein [Orrella sp. NBD-18]|uniref:Tripartite tricarboxylate transporter substrate binding protein n=1 Tax=Sheuella amnicola TaxID=2707330 RepID=A0A6B2R0T1_9BURK|nr:tripartite tricarboxylate transporter substrate binding protein [Sheuella amnicola]NDY83872.1 tripartite tricarboxylate transporter substrate binding protein [Sheuella amnicola]
MQVSKISRIRRASVLLLTGLATALPFSVSAQANYPDKSVRIVVGFSAGGSTDVVARLLAKELGEEFGQSFIVENKPGAGSNIAAEYVARAPADGYTLLMMAVTSTINQTLYPNLKFDILKDLTPVALGAKVPNLLVVNPKVPVNSVKELVAYANKNPGKLNFASSGSGTSIHMTGELFKINTKIDVSHIPYKGSSPAMTDLVGGQVQFMFDNMPSALPLVQSGKLRALAVTSPQRSAAVPDVPTMAEAGFPGFDVSSWFGLMAPAKTPDAVVQKLNAAVAKALASPELKKRLADLGATSQSMTTAEFGDFVKNEVKVWGDVVKASGAQVD